MATVITAKMLAIKQWLLERRQVIRRELRDAAGEIRDLAVSQAEEGTFGSDVANRASDVAQQEMLLMESEALLAEMDQIGAALRRIQDGTYGVCSECGQCIPEGRLEALPTALRDVACERGFEGRRRTLLDLKLGRMTVPTRHYPG